MGSSDRLTVVDFFSGAGGLSEGFKQAGFEPILGVDCDPFAIRTYQRHHGKGIQCRMEDLTADRLLKETGNRRITVLAAGPPCQAFSTVAIAKLRSLKKPTTVRNPMNQMYREFLRLIQSIRPPFFVMENVGRMFSIDNGVIRDRIEKELKGRYRITFYHVNVADFGVPQFRKRGLVIGNSMDLENPELTPTHYDPRTGAVDGRKPYETVRTAISDLPPIRAGEGEKFVRYPRSGQLTDYQMQRRIKSDGIHNHTARLHSERDLKIFKLLRPGQWIGDLPEKYNPYRPDIFKDKIKKQPWDRPSSTILAHLSKDGLMFVHPDRKQNRSLTPREAARIQSFDDSYVFEGPRTQQFVQIGNAVPPLFARQVAVSIMRKMVSMPTVKVRKSLQNHR